MRLRDTRNGYGWISIALHWLTAAIVLTMWTIGTIAQAAAREDASWFVHWHMSIGVSAYALLWGRIIWRFAVGHPEPHPGQSAFLFPVAKYFHFLLLAAIGLMLASGPLMVWSAGEAIEVFALALPSPLAAWPDLQHSLRRIHGVTASFVLLGVILHILAALKHVVVNRDGTFDKIMIPDGAQRDELVGNSKAKA